MDSDTLKTVVESLIFVSDEPVNLKRLCAVLGDTKRDKIKAVLEEIERECIEQRRGVVLNEVAGGYQFRTPPESSKYVSKLFEGRPQRLTRAGLETMAIIAYRQPIVRAEIERIRGVDSGGVLKTLLDRELIQIAGRQDVPGRPALYATTDKFLEFFGLKSLSEMPDLKEIKELGDAAEEFIADEAAEREPAEESADQPDEAPDEAPEETSNEESEETPQ